MEIVSSEIDMAAHFQKQMNKSYVQTRRYKDKEKCRNGKSNIKNPNTHKRSKIQRTVQHLVALKPTDEGEPPTPQKYSMTPQPPPLGRKWHKAEFNVCHPSL